MVRNSLTAVEYRAREAHLWLLAVRPGCDLGDLMDLVWRLEGLGVGPDDVGRVLGLADLVTAQGLPEPLTDVCDHYRIGVFQLAKRRWAAGAQIGAYKAGLFLAWSV